MGPSIEQRTGSENEQNDTGEGNHDSDRQTTPDAGAALCQEAGNDHRYDARRLVDLLLAGLTRPY